MPTLRPGELRADHFANRHSHTLALAGELDLTTSPMLLVLVTQIARRSGSGKLVLDLRPLEFIDSVGLRAILRSRQACLERELEFSVLYEPEGVCHALFDIAGVDDLLAQSDPDAHAGGEDPVTIESVLATPMLSGGARASRLAIRIGPAGTRTVTLTGELEGGTAPALLATTKRLCDGGARQLVLDLDGLARIGPGAAQTFSAAGRICAERRCELRLIPPASEPVRAVLRELGMPSDLSLGGPS